MTLITPKRSLPYVDFAADRINFTLLKKARALVYSETVTILKEKEEEVCKASAKEGDTSDNVMADAVKDDTAPLPTTSSRGFLHPKVACLLPSPPPPRRSAPPTVVEPQTSAHRHFTPQQRLAIRQEYARGERVRAVAVSEALAGGIVEARVAALREEERILKRRRLETVRETEDLNAKRLLLHAGCLLAEGDGAVAERLIKAGPLA